MCCLQMASDITSSPASTLPNHASTASNSNMQKDEKHLKRVEWLYRWSRIERTDAYEYQDFERCMLDGKKEEREGMKTKIFNMERSAP